MRGDKQNASAHESAAATATKLVDFMDYWCTANAQVNKKDCHASRGGGGVMHAVVQN